MLLRSIVPLAVVVTNLAIASAFAAPPLRTDCSGVLQCATVTTPPIVKSPGMDTDRRWYKWGPQRGDRDDRYPRGNWYKNQPHFPSGTPSW